MRQLAPGSAEKTLPAANASLEFAARPLTYQRFRPNALSGKRYGPFMDLITTTAELAAVCARLAKHPVITVDTEFLRETTYYPLLCVVQMASADEAVVIDTLGEGIDLKPFFALMADEKVLKVFHAARQDIEIVWHQAGIVPHPIFDTQVAAMVLGYGDSIAYDQLVERIAGHRPDKTHRFTDWSRRPLTEEQMHYAVADVTHLRDVFAALDADLKKRGRSDWVSQEMEVLTSPKTYDFHPERAWERLKTRVRKPKELAVLMEVAAWREQEAQSRDVPRGRVLKDDAVGDIATHAPTSLERLAGLRSLPKGFDRSKWGADIVAAVQRGLARDPATLPKIEKPRSNSNGAAIVELLKVLLRMTSERHAVASKVIATVDDLEQIAADDNADVGALHGWRRELFGEAALSLKHGRLALAIEKGRVVKVDRN
jgi:ribonuclease D